MRQSLQRVLSPHTCFSGGAPSTLLPTPSRSPPGGSRAGPRAPPGKHSPCPGPSCLPGRQGPRRPGSSPAPRGPPPPTGGLAHAQTEAAGEGAVPEVHCRAVLAGVGASGRAQPQREVPALEAALVQLHAGLQGGPPAAQAAGGQHQHHVAPRTRAPGGGRGGAQAGRGRRRAAGRERGTALRNARGNKPGARGGPTPLRG